MAYETDTPDNFELQKSWINPQTSQIILTPNEKPLIETWQPIPISTKLGLKHRLIEGLYIIGSFCLYAILAYFFQDKRNLPANHAFRALLFPCMIYILSSYRRFDLMIKSMLLGLILNYGIYTVLYVSGLITYEGNLFLHYFIFIVRWFRPSLIPSLGSLPASEIRNLSFLIFNVIMGAEFFLFLLTRVFKRHQKIELFLSEQNIYLRGKTKPMFFSIIWTLFWTIITPININNYRELQQKFRYRKESRREGIGYDYGRFSKGIIQKVEKKKSFRLIHLFIALGLLGIGIFSLQIFFILLGLIWSIGVIRNFLKKKYDVSIFFSPTSVDGSWIMINKASKITFKRVDLEQSELLEKFGFI